MAAEAKQNLVDGCFIIVYSSSLDSILTRAPSPPTKIGLPKIMRATVLVLVIIVPP
jgi:hypothetical protein